MDGHVNVVIPPLSQPLTYRVPEAALSRVSVGCLVEVPLGNRQALGFVIEKLHSVPETADAGFAIKAIQNIEATIPCFAASQLEFFRWVAEYYGEPLSTILDLAVPASAPKKLERTIVLAKTLLPESRGKLQQSIVSELQHAGGSLPYAAVLRKHKGAGPALKRLQELGLISLVEEEVSSISFESSPGPDWAKSEVQLTAEQVSALDQISSHIETPSFHPFTLFGVTGSGKTEVYIEAMRRCIAKQRGVLVIVPEIALTPQLVDRFRARIGEPMAVLHSGLSRRLRWDAWRALLDGSLKIAIGARSAIFAPVQNLGLIIVDEEHDGSFKQNEGPRYHARDLAVVRAKFENAPVILGSATPSLETFHNCRTGRYTELRLPLKFAASQKLDFELIDLSRTKPWDMPSRSISLRLATQIKKTLAADEQCFILYNRRGFANYLQCEACEKVLECPNCSVTLTFHQRTRSLICHYCSLSQAVPSFCPVCEGRGLAATASKTEAKIGSLVQRGAGTERVFEELSTLFPEARIERLDRDAVNSIEDYRRVLDSVRSGETQILVGTQMIAKGHDLPNVTLVGVVDCDVGLHMPDFRAGERVFQLLTQTSGRAGRGDKPGTVVLQTRVPKHPSIQHTITHDYHGFAEIELKQREALRYPPYSRMLRIIASSTDADLAASVLVEMKNRVEQLFSSASFDLSVLGPAPAPLAKLKTLWRSHMLLKSGKISTLHRVMTELRALNLKSKRVRVVFDMDPQELM